MASVSIERGVHVTIHQRYTYLQTFAAKTIAIFAVRVVVSVDVDTLAVAGAGGMQVAGPLDTVLALITGGFGGRYGVVFIRKEWRRRGRFRKGSCAVVDVAVGWGLIG